MGRRMVAVLFVGAVLAPGAALAAPPQDASGEKVAVDESFISQRWTDECGFEVHRRNHGHERIWEEPRGGGGIVFRGVFAIKVTLTGVESGRSYTFQDAGTDRERLLEDGRLELAIVGRSFPANTIGRVVLVDDDVVKVSGRAAYDPDAICASLAP
jgi:hypothetical protein